MKKVLSTLFVVCLVVVISLPAFASTEITFWAMNNAPSEKNIPWMEQKAAEFEAETGYKVKFEEIGWGEAWQKITTAIATGEGAHVMQVGTTWNPFFAGTNGLVKFEMDEFGGQKAFMEANLLSTTLNDEYYGVPWFAETRCLF